MSDAEVPPPTTPPASPAPEPGTEDEMAADSADEAPDEAPDEPVERPREEAGPAAPVPRRWGERSRGMDPENRRRVIDACAIRTSSGWITHFVLMMVLSVLIAVMGLSADSAALVIGAMLLAPLMTPVLGTAASLTMALGRPLRRSLFVLATASIGAIALSWFTSLFLRDGPLSGEVIARTSPDARDLVVALAAGAAGAYATARPDLSSSLPGVAIAVALVPPLAVVGITLEAGRTDLAGGALLLYITNLAAIVVAGVVVLVITGFAPPRRLATTSRSVLLGGGIAAVVMIAIAVPLTMASFRAADRARDRQAVEEAINAWLVGTGDEVDEITLTGSDLELRVFGLVEPDATTLESRIRAILGADATVVVRWTQARLLEADDGPSAEDLLAADVRAIIDRWLQAGAVDSYDLTGLDVSDGSLTVDLTSADPPPGVEDLGRRVAELLGLEPEIEVNWTPRTVLRPDEGDRRLADVEEQLRRSALDWAAGVDGVEVLSVVFDGETVTVDLVGSELPDGTGLEAALRDAVEASDLEVRVWFSERQSIVPAPTPTPTPTPSPSPTPSPTGAAPTPAGTPTPSS